MRAPKFDGYDDGYRAVPCFWGRDAGSMVAIYLCQHPKGLGARVLDLGCGEGKNSAAFSRAGYTVDAVDCSTIALANGRRAFAESHINWCEADVRDMVFANDRYDVIVAYGLFHCLSSISEIALVIRQLQKVTRPGGC